MTPPSGDRALARLLTQSVIGVSGEPLGPEVRAVPVETVIAAGGDHRVTPALARRVGSAPDAPREWADRLAPHRTLQLMRHMQASGDLRRIAEVFAHAGIAWAVGKGPVAADLIWPSPDMREYYDLDVFVGRGDFAAALDELLAAGCTLVDRNWPELSRSMRAEIGLLGPAGTHIDLHWDMAVPPKLRRAFRTDMAGMLGRARPARLGSGVAVSVFDPVDTVVHLVFHAAQAGANRLMWIADIHHATAQPGFDWAEFARRTAAARTTVASALVLDRVSRTLGFRNPPPAAVLAPASSVWGRLARERDERYAFPGLPGDRHQGGTLFSSAREHLAASALDAAVASWRVRATERRITRGADERILRRDVPDAASRTAYLEAVAGV